MVNHSLLKLCLFLCAGAVYMKAHTLDLNQLRGFGRGKILLHIVFLIGALGLAGVPLMNGYTSKTMIHEGLVELAEEVEGFSIYRFCEWVFLFAAGLTTAYMLKLYVCMFWQKNPDAGLQKYYDELRGHSLSVRSALVLILTAVPLILIGVFPNQVLLPLTVKSAGFLNRSALTHAVPFFSLTNLAGGGVSLLIGALVYLFFVRKVLYRPNTGYRDIWPRWLDLEELFYRPVFTRFLPWAACSIAGFLDSLPSSRLVVVWIPKGITAVFSFFDHLPDSKMVLSTIPKAVSGFFSFLDRVPESKLFSKIIPGIAVALFRIFDEMVDHLMLFVRELFLVNGEGLRRTRNHNVFTRLAGAIAEGLYRLGILSKKHLKKRFEEDMEYIDSVTNAISFGLLLGAAGIVAAILYVFIRMNVS